MKTAESQLLDCGARDYTKWQLIWTVDVGLKVIPVLVSAGVGESAGLRSQGTRWRRGVATCDDGGSVTGKGAVEQIRSRRWRRAAQLRGGVMSGANGSAMAVA
nr:hypothetical protein Iba_chr08fCG4000 [Ipomoea batatas]